MDEKNRSQRNKPKKKEKGDWFLTVSLVQMVFCAFFCLIVFVCAKTNPEAAESLRADFSTLMQWNVESQDVQAVAALVREYFTSSGETTPVFGGFAYNVDEPPSVSEPQETTAAPKAAAEPASEALTVREKTTDTPKKQKKDPAPQETTTTAPAAKKAQNKRKKATEDGSGGEDVTALSAKENTSFSPTAVTVPIVRPVRGGRYSSKFGYRVNPITHVKSFHTGLDIAVPLGTKIHAAYAGQVRAVGEDSRSGKYIILRHDDGFETFYCHCSSIVAAEGDPVAAGDVIARVGSTGWSTGPHLHFEVRKNGERLDPLQILEDGV